jgi:NADH-quinone oxidoreductase subunit M
MLYRDELLELILLVPFLGACLMLIIPENFGKPALMELSLFISTGVFILNIFLWEQVEPVFQGGYHCWFTFNWLLGYCSFGLDGISFFFILLTTFIFPLCFLYSWTLIYKYNFIKIKLYLVNFLFLQFFILNVFCTLNLFIFFIFFEAILIPMVLIIGIWGPGDRRIKANYYFIFYTLVGSILLLFAILVIYLETGTSDFLILFNLNWATTRVQLALWFCFFLSFAIKMPMFPFHIWLPEAHVEAPTAASVILAALLLKLGGYGFIRFLPLFPYAYIYFNPLMYTLGVISIIYASFVTIRQIDLKKIIAYSSVAHMNLGTVGIFSLNFQGMQGSIFLMLSHGLVSSALFFLVGMLYDRYYTKFLRYYGGIAIKMPIYSSILLFFSLANLGFPGTSNFIGELLILIGIVEKNISIMILTASGMLFSSIYSIWLFNRLCFGNIKIEYISEYQDITRREYFCIFPLIFLTLCLGICPDIIFSFTSLTLKSWCLFTFL